MNAITVFFIKNNVYKHILSGKMTGLLVNKYCKTGVNEHTLQKS